MRLQLEIILITLVMISFVDSMNIGSCKFRFTKEGFASLMAVRKYGYSGLELRDHCDDEGNNVSAFDNIPSVESNEIEKDIKVKQAIKSILIMGDEKLGERNIFILKRLFLESSTLISVGEELGVSAERVRQLRNIVIKKISDNLEEYDICDSLNDMI